MIIGGMWLIYSQKIYIDKESNRVTEIQTPIGKFRTNVPALALFILGFIPLIFPIIKSAGFDEQIRITGKVKSDAFPVDVYVVIKSDSIHEDRDFSITVPMFREDSDDYKVLYSTRGIILEDRADLTKEAHNAIQLDEKDIRMSSSIVELQPQISAIPAEFDKQR